jgi:demethylmenaquinone methyltransferase/2-methoxy-6-polyprenyl-1,4-benzoquinol methylase
MAISYKIISKFYNLLDTVGFRDNNNNPRKIILKNIPNDNLKILDIAVGTARNSILLATNRNCLNITGIDLSEEMLKIAQKDIERQNIKNITLLKMDAVNMAFEYRTFDIIIISLLLHELNENIANKILNDCKNILKPDGKIYILEWDKPKNIIQKMLFSIIEILEPKEYKLFMKKDLEEYFNKNNFNIENIEYGDYTKIIELKIGINKHNNI